jgi:hypothetical protein
LWVKHKDCRYERRADYVRVQRYWDENELDEDLFSV